VRLHTWIVDPSNGRLIATHEQILGDRLTNQTYLFGTFQSAGLETLNAMQNGMFPKPIEYPASLAGWQENLVTSELTTFGSLTAYQAVQPQSWAQPNLAGFYPFLNPVAKANQLTRLRVFRDATGYVPSLPGLFGSSPVVAIEAAPIAQIDQALFEPDSVFQFRQRLPQRADLIADYPVFAQWGFDLSTQLSGLFYPFDSIAAIATIAQLLTATPSDGFGIFGRTELVFADVGIPGSGTIVRRRPSRYFRLLNALGAT
jgi:hypothetical protein